MRKLPLLASLLAAAPLAAQDFDPELTRCLALTYIVLDQAEQDAATASDDRLAQLIETLQPISAALGFMMAEQADCSQPIDQLRAPIQTIQEQIMGELRDRLAEDGVDPAGVYRELVLLPARACNQAIGQERIDAANERRLTNGYACGWGQ